MTYNMQVGQVRWEMIVGVGDLGLYTAHWWWLSLTATCAGGAFLPVHRATLMALPVIAVSGNVCGGGLGWINIITHLDLHI